VRSYLGLGRSVWRRVGLGRHGSRRMVVWRRFLCACQCGGGLGEIGTHRCVPVFACALGLTHFEVAWGLLLRVLCTGITATTWATLAAVAVA
jgi:hypothetical protein